MAGLMFNDDGEIAEYGALCSALQGLRWPWAPLEQALGGTTTSQARALGVHDRQVYRWRDEGLTDAMADRCAIRAGLHPAIVWGPAWHAPHHQTAEEAAQPFQDVA